MNGCIIGQTYTTYEFGNNLNVVIEGNTPACVTFEQVERKYMDCFNSTDSRNGNEITCEEILHEYTATSIWIDMEESITQEDVKTEPPITHTKKDYGKLIAPIIAVVILCIFLCTLTSIPEMIHHYRCKHNMNN